jgi:xylulokinase
VLCGMKYLVGIDLGTTGLKASLFNAEGVLLGKGYSPNSYLPGPQGWAEQDPRMWWTGCCHAIHTALAESQVAAEDIAGISVCGFHHCPVFLDGDGEPTRPTIVTHDSRLTKSLDELRQQGLAAEIAKTSGSIVTTGHFPPIFYHLLQHERHTLDNTRWILLAKDYLRFKLTGEIGTEICDASGTHLIAMPEQQWSSAICRLLNVPQEKLPELGISSGIAGEISPEAARATGLRTGTPVVYGGGDSHCALLGLGVIGSAQIGMLLGTNSTLRASFQGFTPSSGDYIVWKQQHVAPGRFTASSSSMAGSSVLSWFKEMFCKEFEGQDDDDTYRELEALATVINPGCDGLLFHPYLYGERSPFYNPHARGSFLAAAYWHRKGHFIRSVMEGVAFCIANCFDVLEDIAQQRDETIQLLRIGASGGGRSTLWKQIISDTLSLPIDVMQVEEPGCLGAAMLAGVGVGIYQDLEEAVQRAVHLHSRTLPDTANADVYKEKRVLFNRAFQALELILYHQ